MRRLLCAALLCAGMIACPCARTVAEPPTSAVATLTDTPETGEDVGRPSGAVRGAQTNPLAGVGGAAPCCQSSCPRCCPPLGGWWRLRGVASLFQERPHGSLLHAHMQTQVFQGAADQAVLHRYDFVHWPVAAAPLHPRGEWQLRKAARIAAQLGVPLVIEKTDNDPELDEWRRQTVLQKLAEWGLEIPEERILVAKVTSTGLNGIESEVIYENLLQQTFSQGGNLSGGRGLTIGSRAAVNGASGTGGSGSTVPSP